MNRLLYFKEKWLFIVLFCLILFFSFSSKAFLRPDNFIDLLKNNSVLYILAIGMTLIIATGYIDLSVGAIVSTLTVVLGKCITLFNMNIFLTYLIVILLGVILGSINGILIGWGRVPSIIATLGSSSIISGILFYLTNGAWINTHSFPRRFLNFGYINLLGIPIQIIISVLVGLFTWFILKYTPLGLSIVAIGGNLSVASRLGINSKLTTIIVYMYMGLLAGIASLTHTSIVFQVDPNAFSGFEMRIIAAVFMGNMSTSGRSGLILGTTLGVLFISILNNGLVLIHVPAFWQQLIIGIIILVTISINVVRRKRSERKLVNIRMTY
jgi:simple sugar transport system permease protein